MDIETAKQEFEKFLEKYDIKNERIKYKKSHSYRVMQEAEQIAKSLNLSEEEIQIAMLIGLLHDIGRFEQIKRYNTFKDYLSVDHGDLGVEILTKDNYIRNYIKETKYDSIILKAIKNHNKFKIEEGLSEKELVFAKIIRDADKLDIFYEGVMQFWNTDEKIKEIEESEPSLEILEKFKNKQLINNKEEKTPVDRLLKFFSFIFDINFKYSIQKIQNEDYVNKVLSKFSFKNKEIKEMIRRAYEIS